ncbi:MAG: DNA polymerase III subunit alpha [Armatimonadetes bacterium]|nr:DNA polymerase III subunit alpha [Armatimonadota bacterium]
MGFAHLHVHTPFSFLDGAAGIKALARAAAEHGMPALAMTDHNNVSAAVQFHQACAAEGLKPILGAEVTLVGGRHLTLLAENPCGYANLCRLVSHAHLSQPRRRPAASLDALREHAEGLLCLSGCRRGCVPSLLLAGDADEALAVACELRDIFGADRFFLELQRIGLPGTRRLHAHLVELAERLGVDLVAANNVHHLRREDFHVHDVLTCARTLTVLEDVHPERPLNAQQYLRSPEEMAELFWDCPQALDNAGRIAERCEPALQPGQYRFPAYALPPGETAPGLLRKLVAEGARRRYGRITGEVRERLERELSVIGQLGFDEYFLVVWDLLRFARERGIRFAGRGSAADSAVAYCLGIANVDAIARRLLFERFMSLERAAMPDIDIDFEAERRDEIMAYVIERYGREHVAMVATYNTFQARSAVRDLGKAMGFPLGEVDRLARHLPYLSAREIDAAFQRVPELRDSGIPRERYRQLIETARAVAGFPRHLSTHLGGLVVTREPLMDLTPVQMAAKGLPVIQFDKDDVEDLGLVKLDLLCLRMLGAVEDSIRAIRTRDASFDYDAIPPDDAESYRLVAASDTVGVFQLESPAQKALHARLQPDRFEDLIAAVALIRPGPIIANMVDPYIERRQGKTPVAYLHPSLRPILEKTYGVVLFQEQVIEIATEVAGFTPGEADQLRRAMTHNRSWEEMEQIGRQFIAQARTRGVGERVAKEIFSYIQAYAGYGFCEAHAAAFADTAYKTAYLKRHHPAEFYAALLSNQPMGYYPPNTLLWEARRKGIEVRGPDLNRSEAQYTVEDGALRVGLAQVRGIGQSALDRLIAAREPAAPFASLLDLARRTRVDRDVLRNLILAGALDSLHPNRRQLLWELSALGDPTRLDAQAPLPFSPLPQGEGPGVRDSVPDFSPSEKWWQELDALGLALSRHPMAIARGQLQAQGVLTCAEVRAARTGATVKVAGLIIRPHRPPTKSGRTVVFFTLEDETELLEVTVFESVYQRCGKAIFTQPMLLLTGRVDRRGAANTAGALVASHVEGYTMVCRDMPSE